jgi:hypothetical protein
MKQRTTLYAEDGMVLTDGTNYGTIIHLAVGADASKWHEISVEEYENILAENEANEGVTE